MHPVYALGKIHSGSIFILTKFDQNYRSATEYIPIFRTLSEAEMELTLMGNRALNVLTFDSAEDLQKNILSARFVMSLNCCSGITEAEQHEPTASAKPADYTD